MKISTTVLPMFHLIFGGLVASSSGYSIVQKAALSTARFKYPTLPACGVSRNRITQTNRRSKVVYSTSSNTDHAGDENPKLSIEAATSLQKEDSSSTVPLYRKEGLFAVCKPLDWTSQDAVSFIRKLLERDARERGASVAKLARRGNKKQMIRVGHGGTLDPLATGVLVIGIGKGTKMLQSYLTGSKNYRASAELGFETTTLDMEGEITKKMSHSHVKLQSVQNTLPLFVGKIMQIPPIFSAIRKNGKRLYEEARSGKTAEDMKIEPREVEIYDLTLLPMKEENLPSFSMDIECGGGTYIRSLIRDVGHELNCVATMTSLSRTKQGPFILDSALEKEDWNAENICSAIEMHSKLLDSTSHE